VWVPEEQHAALVPVPDGRKEMMVISNQKCLICGSYVPLGGLTFHQLIKHGIGKK
jgi:hypothetical protein